MCPDYYFTVKYFTGRKEKKVDGNFCILEDFGDNKPRPSVKRCDGCKAFETECLCKLYHNADDRTVEVCDLVSFKHIANVENFGGRASYHLYKTVGKRITKSKGKTANRY